LRENNLCARKAVLEQCYPAPKMNYEEVVDFMEFNYNFLREGFLVQLLPVSASFARMGFSQGDKDKKFIRKMFLFRLRLALGLEKLVFKDALGNRLNFNFNRFEFFKKMLSHYFSAWFWLSTLENYLLRMRYLAKRWQE